MNRATLERARTELQRHGDWFALGGVGIAVLALSFWVAGPARRIAADARTEIAKMEQAVVVVSDMRERFVPASPEETREWSRTRAEVADFGTPPGTQLHLAQAVTRAAEDAGLNRVRVRFAPPETLTSVPPRLIAGQEFVGGGYGFQLQADSDVGATMRLLDALPAAIEVQQVEIGGGRVSLLLIAYESVGGA